MNLLGVGPAELLLVFVIAIVVLGPERMVQTARSLGRLYARWRSGWGREVEEMTRELRREIAKLQHEMDQIRREAQEPLKMLVADETIANDNVTEPDAAENDDSETKVSNT